MLVKNEEEDRSGSAMSKLVLMPLADRPERITQAVMYETAAAKYVMLGIHDFRKLVEEGVIPFRRHLGRTRRIYLKSDLDSYLSRLPRGKITQARIHQTPRTESDL